MRSLHLAARLAKTGKLLELLRFFLPLECPVCGGQPFDGSPNMFCKDCLQKIEFLTPPVCPMCGCEYNGLLDVCPLCLQSGKRPWDGALSVFRMNGLVKELLHNYKYHKQPELAALLGELCLLSLRNNMPHIDCIVPVPLHWRRFLQRGFNQSEELSKRLGQGLGIPVVNALRRKKYTKQQAKLGKEARISNLSGAFSINHSTFVEKRAILLVDDVMTTGATLSAAARALKRAGAAKVYVFTVARRQRN